MGKPLRRTHACGRVAADLGIPAVIAGVVGTVCVILALACWRAMLRTGNRHIYFVMAAFTVLAVKAFAKAFMLASIGQEGPQVELAFSLFDLTAVGLFAWPILRRGGAGR
jgi:hypothetical protein